MGDSNGRMMSWLVGRSGTDSRFSANVLPVTVMQFPWMRPLDKRYLRTEGVPPILCKSSITYLPLFRINIFISLNS